MKTKSLTTQNATATGTATSHSMECYFEEMNRFRLLSREEEVELGTKIQKDGDPEAIERMVNANLRLVVTIANEYSKFGLPVEDLVAEGNLGLMKAAERFDPNYGVKFSTYASWWIKQAIKRALGNQSRTIRLPLHVIQKLRDLDRAERDLGIELGHEPSLDELSQCEGFTRQKIEHLRQVSQPVVSIDDHTSPDGVEHPQLATYIPDESAPDPTDETIRHETEANLTEMLSLLNPRERDIVSSRFGLDDREPLTLEEIGEAYGVSRERVRQIQVVALEKLRVALKRLEVPARQPKFVERLVRQLSPAPQLAAVPAQSRNQPRKP